MASDAESASSSGPPALVDSSESKPCPAAPAEPAGDSSSEAEQDEGQTPFFMGFVAG